MLTLKTSIDSEHFTQSDFSFSTLDGVLHFLYCAVGRRQQHTLYCQLTLFCCGPGWHTWCFKVQDRTMQPWPEGMSNWGLQCPY